MKEIRYILLFLTLTLPFREGMGVGLLSANDTVYVSGAIDHSGLLEWNPKWHYGSNSYLDLSVHYRNDSNRFHFKELRATTRLEMMQWPLPGYDDDFAGHGIGHLSLAATFDFGEITVGDVYGQFGSGFILNLYEERYLGIDGSLRGAKFDLTPYKGIHLTLLGGKQRRFWNCYKDRAWGWNYTQDAVLGADLELQIDRWSKRMQELDMSLLVGGSYVSKYQQFDSVYVANEAGLYIYNLPLWVGAGDIRANWQWRGWDVLVEYAYKANDPCDDNNFSYRPGQALMASVSYSRKGLSVLAQFKHSDNMSFFSSRHCVSNARLDGRLNLLPMFCYQHTYALPSLNAYATQYGKGEWAFQTEIRYTFPRKTKMGGRYGTTLQLSASHIRGTASEGSWAIDTRTEGEYYTDVHVAMDKRITKNWWLNAMLMYQTMNFNVTEGEGGLMRAGIAVVDTRVRVTDDVAMRAELQYLYTPHYDGQWIFALYELSLFRCLTISGEYMYNIGRGQIVYERTEADRHFYTASATYTNGAHRLQLGYTKTIDGYNCSGGVCRYVPTMTGLTLTYNFSW
ncbi:MAG: hypothetical protein IKD12_02935 [Paludibacteraceae bacterium]|nr:hypothetical protein [Paludibacteraceae bacterium]